MLGMLFSRAGAFARAVASRHDDAARTHEQARQRAEERELLIRLRDGDVSAFETIIAAHLNRLTRFATYLLGAADAAEDCVQTVLVHLWEHRTTLDVERPLRPYLLRAVQNRVASERRAQGVRERYRDSAIGADRTSVQNPEDAILTGAMVQTALSQLSERRQLALRLRLEEGLTDLEVGGVLGISAQATDRLIRRALADLKDLLLGVSKK